MIALSHVVFGGVACSALFCILKLRGIHSPPRLFHAFLLFMNLFPDVDHLYWMEIRMEHLFPVTVWDLFEWRLRLERNPLNFLHYWLYPLTALVFLTAPLAPKTRWTLFGIFLGWAVHLILDGVLLLV